MARALLLFALVGLPLATHAQQPATPCVTSYAPPDGRPQFEAGILEVGLRQDVAVADFEALLTPEIHVERLLPRIPGGSWYLLVRVPVGCEEATVERLAREAEALVKYVGLNYLIIPRQSTTARPSQNVRLAVRPKRALP